MLDIQLVKWLLKTLVILDGLKKIDPEMLKSHAKKKAQALLNKYNKILKIIQVKLLSHLNPVAGIVHFRTLCRGHFKNKTI
jgi:hypothetical protein